MASRPTAKLREEWSKKPIWDLCQTGRGGSPSRLCRGPRRSGPACPCEERLRVWPCLFQRVPEPDDAKARTDGGCSDSAACVFGRNRFPEQICWKLCLRFETRIFIGQSIMNGDCADRQRRRRHGCRHERLRLWSAPFGDAPAQLFASLQATVKAHDLHFLAAHFQSEVQVIADVVEQRIH